MKQTRKQVSCGAQPPKLKVYHKNSTELEQQFEKYSKTNVREHEWNTYKVLHFQLTVEFGLWYIAPAGRIYTFISEIMWKMRKKQYRNMEERMRKGNKEKHRYPFFNEFLGSW